MSSLFRSTDIRVLIVATARLYGDGLARSLDQFSDVAAAGVACTVHDTLRLIRSEPPPVVLVESTMPHSRDLVRAIKASGSGVRVVVLAVDAVTEDVLEWAEIGIAGFVAADESVECLVEALRAASCGRFLCTAATAGRMLERLGAVAVGPAGVYPAHPAGDEGPRLTGRELEVLSLVAEGFSNKRIAGLLGISLATVKNHVHSILGKMRVSRRGEAGARWRRRWRNQRHSVRHG